MPSYSDISLITTSTCFDRTTLEAYKDGAGKSMRNLVSVTRVTDLTGAKSDVLIAKIIGSGVPASSGTTYKPFSKGSTYLDSNTGIWYSKTSDTGATDTWAALNNV